MNNPYSAGKLVYLRHPTREDALGSWHEWFSDKATTRWLTHRYWPNSIESQIKFYESLSNDQSRLVLSIIDIESNTHIGVCNLSNINWVHRFADIAIVIGDSKFRSGTYMLESMSLLIEIAFKRLNLHKLISGYAASNDASEMLHRLLRFSEVGRIGELIWDRGTYVDEVIATLDATDWLARNTNA